MSSDDSALSGKVSSRPFFMWAMVQYLREDQLTPLMVVDANYPGVCVPQDFVDPQTGQITLSLGVDATRNLQAQYDALIFDAAFPGQVVEHIHVPCLAIVAILCQEDPSLSMIVSEQERTYGFSPLSALKSTTPLGFGDKSQNKRPTQSSKMKKKSHLRLVKPGDQA